jgi:hypothetical protein
MKVADKFSIARNGQRDRNLYTVLLENALDRALNLDSKVLDATLTMQGMSGRCYRMLINNLVASVPRARYLEIGSWKGSTACSAMEGNRARVVCIDNWSEFNGPKDEFMANTARCITRNVEFRFIENDFKTIDYSNIGTFNIYLFDGPHTVEDHFAGVSLPLPALDDEFFFIVDDWNWEGVRRGTIDSIRKAGLSIIHSIEIRTTQDDTHAELVAERSDWHNGYFLAVLRKRPAGESDVHIAAGDTTIETLAHIQNKGDTVSDAQGWAGMPGSKLAVEGFAILKSPAALDCGFICQAVLADMSLSAPVAMGEYSGTRGENTPLHGLRICTHAQAAKQPVVTFEAWFVDGEHVGPLPAGAVCTARSKAALEAFRIVIRGNNKESDG